MNLRDYIGLLRKRWMSVCATALLVLAAVAAATMAATPSYRATTTVFFAVQSPGSSASDLVQGTTYAEKQVQSYAEVATSPLVLTPVIDGLDLNRSPEDLAGSITTAIPTGTAILEISAADVNPETAANIANAVADELSSAVGELTPEGPDGTESVRATIISAAVPSTSPASPNPSQNILLGLLLGTALGIGQALLREVLNTRVRTEDDVRRVTENSVVGTIAYDEDAPSHPLIVQADPHSARAEAYRRLRTNLQFLDIADRPHSIVITSSLPREGKSTTSINLAITLAEAGTRVLLVDADLRRPQVAKYMQLEGRVGLTTVLIGRADLADVVQPWGNGNLHVLPSGQVPPNPSELLGSRAMESLMEVAASAYDVVLLDAPPLLPVTDGAILAGRAGGALVVVGSDGVHLSQLEDSLESLQSVDARVLGLVLNKVQRKHVGKYQNYNYESTYAPQLEHAKRARVHRGARRPVATKRSGVRSTGPTGGATDDAPPLATAAKTTDPSNQKQPPSIPPRHATAGTRGT
jgi:succinoglycan biosynthesis transport protein ExoP